MRIWIDATQLDESVQVFGMSLLERHLRLLSTGGDLRDEFESGVRTITQIVKSSEALYSWIESTELPTVVTVEIAEGAETPTISRSVSESVSIQFRRVDPSLPVGARLAAALQNADHESHIIFASNTVIDARIVDQLVWGGKNEVFRGRDESGPVTILRLDGCGAQGGGDGAAGIDEGADSLESIAQSLISEGHIDEIGPATFQGYIPKLRRTQPAYGFAIPNRASVGAVERFLFHSNYKGSTDFLTKYVYPSLVWRAVKILADRGVHPNAVTAVAVIATFAAVPLFAAGAWFSAMLLAFGMSVLDSVDGKLARLTFSSSSQGNLLDHGTDLVHPPFWYFAWAWGLSGGDASSTVFLASAWMFGLYVFDRMLERLFKVCTGRSVQDIRPIDVKLRNFTSRRNVNLAIMVVALPLGLGIPGFYGIVGLQLVTAIYHLVRVIQFWDGDPHSTKRPQLGGDVSLALG